MLKQLYRFFDYLFYLITSKTRHGLHSPFVYQFNERIIHGKERDPRFDLIENARRSMIKSKTRIDFTDLGGGNRSGKREISEIASQTGREAKYGRLLYRILRWQQPEFALELGTATGITAMYQACALSPHNPLHTIEGSQALTEISSYNAGKCGVAENLQFHTGSFEKLLPVLLGYMPRIDFAYVDGNHRYRPTLDYFDMLAAKAHEGTVLVFDDIYWSEEMKQAWSVIKNDPRVTVTIDIFAFGIVFFRKGQEKEHFTIRY